MKWTLRRQDKLLGYSDIAGTLFLELHRSQAVLPVNVWIYCDAFPLTLPHLLHYILPSLSALDISFYVTQCVFDWLALNCCDSLNGLNCVWASRQTNTFVKFMQFSKTLNCKYCKIILFVALTLCCASNLTAVCISQKTDKSYLKKSYKEYSVSDISRSVYVAIMWKCLSRWFICIVIIISLRSPQLICDGLEPLTSRPKALGRVFPTFACGPKGQYVS